MKHVKLKSSIPPDIIALLRHSSMQGSITPFNNTNTVLRTTNQAPAIELNFYQTIVHAQLSGCSSLPYGIGLPLPTYLYLLALINNSTLIEQNKQWHSNTAKAIEQKNKSDLITHLVSLRESEKNDLIQLLQTYKNPQLSHAHLAATIIATACLNPAHLWKSLGFNNREILSQWIALNFPGLHAKNTKGMRWKRFFYLQLCQQGGDYVCRAPSCEACSSFSECFISTPNNNIS